MLRVGFTEPQTLKVILILQKNFFRNIKNASTPNSRHETLTITISFLHLRYSVDLDEVYLHQIEQELKGQNELQEENNDPLKAL